MIFLCGDPHGNFAHIVNLTLAHRPAGVVLLGDLQAQRPLEVELAPILDQTELYWIPGNHDTDSEQDYKHLFLSGLADRNLHGRVVEIDGIRIAGLGGVFRGKIWMPPAAPVHRNYEAYASRDEHGKRHPIKCNLCQVQAVRTEQDDLQDVPLSGRKRKHMSSIFPDTYEALAALKADILVTHEAPVGHPHGFTAIDDLARRMGVSRLFHGHHHDRFKYLPAAFQAYAVGFCGVTNEAGRIIRAGDFDDDRKCRDDWQGGGDRE